MARAPLSSGLVAALWGVGKHDQPHIRTKDLQRSVISNLGHSWKIRFNEADRKLERTERAKADSTTGRAHSVTASGGSPGEPTRSWGALGPPPGAKRKYTQIQRDRGTIRVTKGCAK